MHTQSKTAFTHNSQSNIDGTILAKRGRTTASFCFMAARLKTYSLAQSDGFVSPQHSPVPKEQRPCPIGRAAEGETTYLYSLLSSRLPSLSRYSIITDSALGTSAFSESNTDSKVASCVSKACSRACFATSVSPRSMPY